MAKYNTTVNCVSPGYTEKEKTIIKKTLIDLSVNKEEIVKIMNEAENSGFSESDSSVIHRILEKTYKDSKFNLYKRD